MKFKNISLTILTIFFMLTACNEDYLERLPIDAVSTNDYWSTANDLKLFVNQFYTSFSDGGSWSGGIFWLDTGTDDLIHNNYSSRIAGFRTVPSSGGWSYSAIRSVNYFLENYQTVEGDPTSYNQYVGEAYFFRAYFYFNLLTTYGDVPWVEKTLQVDSEELFASRTSRKTIAENILKDLDQAISMMNSGPNENGTRLNKEIALLFKSRVALYEGTWEKYHQNTPFGVSGSDGTAFLQAAADAAGQLINSGVYSIYQTGNPNADYWHLFNAPYNYNGHPEVMLWKKYDIGLGLTHNHQRYLPRIGGGRGVTQSLINDYLCIDGKPIDGNPLYQGDATTDDVILNRDPRIFQTIYSKGWPMEIVGSDTIRRFDRSHLWASDGSKCTTGYQINKGALPDPNQYYTGGVGVNPSIIFRFGEALLNFAEAKAELGTLTQTDVDNSINLLRARVNMPNLILSEIENDPNWLFPDLSPVINEVRRERHVELAVEGYRWNDLMRWRAHHLFINQRPKGAMFIPELYPELTIGSSVFVDENGYIDPYQTALPNGYLFNSNRDYLAPISTEQLTLNNNLVQNPGWDE
jgi:starch-binding outer membrane protein, SusD/RagB family